MRLGQRDGGILGANLKPVQRGHCYCCDRRWSMVVGVRGEQRRRRRRLFRFGWDGNDNDDDDDDNSYQRRMRLGQWNYDKSAVRGIVVQRRNRLNCKRSQRIVDLDLRRHEWRHNRIMHGDAIQQLQ